MLVRPIPVSRFQQSVLESKSWLRGYVGGRNAGKSKVGSIWISKYAKDGYPCMCVCPDANVAVETSFQSMIETVKYTGQYIKDVQSPLPKVVFRTWDGGVADIVFKGAEVPKKIRGPSKAMLWIDEAQIISEEAFQVAIGVCRFRRKMSPVLATFTPFGFRHWTFSAFFDRIEDYQLPMYYERQIAWFNGKPYVKKADTELIHCATKDNPFAPRDYVRLVGQNYSSRMRDQELEGLYLEIAGLMFQRAKFKLVEEAPLDCQRIRYWDKASTPNDGCFSAGGLIARARNGQLYIEHMIRGQWSASERNEIMMQIAEADYQKYGGTVQTFIEQEGAGSGKEINDQMMIMLGKYPVYTDNASTSAVKVVNGVRLPGDAKIRRSMPLSAQVENGNVSIVAGRWNMDFLDEICLYPEYRFTDQVDAVSAGYNKLMSFGPDNLTSERYTGDAGLGHYGRAVELTDSDRRSDIYRTRLPWNN